jgi:hypothetical protein
MDEIYYIWSVEHNAWWGPAERGYYRGLASAGEYSRDHALSICRDAIPSSAHVGAMAEIPVRKLDVDMFLAGRPLPKCVMAGDR